MKVTFIIAVYNQMQYVEKSLVSAFDQDYNNIEFIISDDHSTDDSLNIIKKTVKHYNKLNIKFHRNSKNLGITENFKKNIKLSSGDIIVGGSGDDIYSKYRVSEIVKAFKENKKTSAVFSNGYVIDKNGTQAGLIFKNRPIFSKNKLQMYHKKIWIHGATAAYRKDICKKFCLLNYKMNFQEDSVMSLISCLYGEIKYLDKKLIYYRLHESNVSSPKKINSLLEIFLNKPNIYKSRIYFLVKSRIFNLLIVINLFFFAVTYLYRFLHYLNVLEFILKLKFKKVLYD